MPVGDRSRAYVPPHAFIPRGPIPFVGCCVAVVTAVSRVTLRWFNYTDDPTLFTILIAPHFDVPIWQLRNLDAVDLVLRLRLFTFTTLPRCYGCVTLDGCCCCTLLVPLLFDLVGYPFIYDLVITGPVGRF